MKPRIFVSSTYYDLKHVRERLEKFIDNYGFESVLFESDKVTYELEKPIDESAYNEVTLCHIMVLIIGGRYGTNVSSDKIEDHKKYEQEYISITRREFDTALSKNIPIFIFVDKNVYSDYETYKENQNFFENFEDSQKKDSKLKFKFAHVDSINIFKFIDDVKSKPIKTFDKVEQIENYLQNQFAGLFYLYLDGLQKQKEVQKVLDSVTELNSISLRMNEMLNSVGKKILGTDHEEYENVINTQLEMIVDFFCNQIYDMISIKLQDEEKPVEFEIEVYNKIADEFYNEFLKNLVEFNTKSRVERNKSIQNYNIEMSERMDSILASNGFQSYKVEKGRFFQANFLYHRRVHPFIKTDKHLEILLNRFRQEFYLMI
ncbi:DUF4062 domain-containing protein [Flavobacterium sp.]|uniref:DUF4062 domain-containing protein n=1 Tax=Flavobacterium sp. TaxID=239 RepID=UPI003F697EF9